MTVFGGWPLAPTAGVVMRVTCGAVDLASLPTVRVVAAGTSAVALALARRVNAEGAGVYGVM